MRREIKLPDNPTVDELKTAAAQAREFAEEMRGKATMWDSYAHTLERRINELRPDLPCGCATPCRTCQRELARHKLPLL